MDEEETNKQLREENKQLKLENELLKAKMSKLEARLNRSLQMSILPERSYCERCKLPT